jgi:hypothetical protein
VTAHGARCKIAGMDAISPEFQLDPTGTGSFVWRDWQIDDEHELSFHVPTRAVFSMSPAPDATDLATISIYQMRARLIHVCDGFPVPDALPTLAASAMIAFAYKNGFVKFTFWAPGTVASGTQISGVVDR